MDKLARVEKFQEDYKRLNPWNDPAFRKMIQAALEILNMTERELGRRIGVSSNAIVRWEQGSYFPHPHTRLAIRNLLFHEVNRRFTDLDKISMAAEEIS